MKDFYCSIDSYGQDAGTITCSAENEEEAKKIIEEMLSDDESISFIGKVQEVSNPECFDNY